MLKFSVIIVFLSFIALWMPSCKARPKDSITECTNDTFIEGIVECIALKFEPILPLSGYSYQQNTYYNGRKPLEFHAAKDIGIRQNYVAPTISKRLSKSHRKMLDHMYEIGKAVIHKEYEVMAIEKLKHVNFEEVFYDYISDILHHVEPFTRIQPADFQFDSKESQHEDHCSQLCNTLPQFCYLCYNFMVIDQVKNMVQCLSQFQQEDFEDNIRWVKCFYNCEDLIPISGCVKEHFSQCEKWTVIGDVVIRAFADFTELDTCLLNVDAAENITLVEGGNAAFVNIHSYMPPGALCVDLKGLSEPLGMIRALGTLLGVILGNSPDCVVQIQMSLQNFWDDLAPHIDRRFPPIEIGRPKCHDKNAIRQAVIGYHEHASHTETCIINITSSNWNATHTVPIWPSVDLKQDGDITTNFTIKLRIDNMVKFNKKIPVTIEDADPGQVSLCQASGDPHITTFDGHYYNNIYDGYFYLYKNEHLPYQVQVLFQRCTPEGNASCTCAVAVKSGDDVFVVDRCRRTTDVHGEAVIMKVLLYLNGELTAGTRIFRKTQGSEFQVILPTGTKVAIAVNNEFLNVYLMPSTNDWQSTHGLCGVYDADATNDLQMPDGTIYNGPGSTEGEQPRNFSKAWRVPKSDQIFEGTLPEDMPDENGPFCKCNYVLFKGVNCTCGHGEIIETCDENLDGELTENLPAIVRKSKKTTEFTHHRTLDDVDIDDNFEPPEIDWSDNVVWNKILAESMCEDFIKSEGNPNLMVSKCINVTGENFVDQAIKHCIQDIQITDSDVWKFAALESAKRKCLNEFLRKIDLDTTDYLDIQNSTCLNDCNGKGTCVQGVCHCTTAWTGGDCSIPSTETPVVIMTSSSQCDKRHEDCRFATVYGMYFPDDSTLKCDVQEAQIDKDGQFQLMDSHEVVDVLHLSPDQVTCYLSKPTSYQISLQHNGVPLSVKQINNGIQATSDSFNFISYDSACYNCNLESDSCALNPEEFHYCIIENICYQENETNPEESCQYCSSKNEWSWFHDEDCSEREDDFVKEIVKAERDRVIRISVACLLTSVIIILTIILFICSKINSETKEAHSNSVFTTKDEVFKSDDLTTPLPTPRLQQVRALDGTVESKGTGNIEFENARKSAHENRKHKERSISTTSNHSAQSRGLGGGGPLAFTQYQHFTGSEDEDDHIYQYVSNSYDKGMGAHATPPITKKPYNNSSVTTWF